MAIEVFPSPKFQRRLITAAALTNAELTNWEVSFAQCVEEVKSTAVRECTFIVLEMVSAQPALLVTINLTDTGTAVEYVCVGF